MEVTRESNEPRYVISVAARMVGVQVHTLRYYEKIGIIEPRRSPGKIRLYSERDITLLRRVKTLMDDLGINLAGIEVILRMSQRVAELQSQIQELESELQKLREGGEL
jgi:MerR family transcriptional regulator/heat shock protein HspR